LQRIHRGAVCRLTMRTRKKNKAISASLVMLHP
jgi:hypothetical protein